MIFKKSLSELSRAEFIEHFNYNSTPASLMTATGLRTFVFKNQAELRNKEQYCKALENERRLSTASSMSTTVLEAN